MCREACLRIAGRASGSSGPEGHNSHHYDARMCAGTGPGWQRSSARSAASQVRGSHGVPVLDRGSHDVGASGRLGVPDIDCRSKQSAEQCVGAVGGGHAARHRRRQRVAASVHGSSHASRGVITRSRPAPATGRDRTESSDTRCMQGPMTCGTLRAAACGPASFLAAPLLACSASRGARFSPRRRHPASQHPPGHASRLAPRRSKPHRTAAASTRVGAIRSRSAHGLAVRMADSQPPLSFEQVNQLKAKRVSSARRNARLRFRCHRWPEPAVVAGRSSLLLHALWLECGCGSTAA